jgi:hypothetical protein
MHLSNGNHNPQKQLSQALCRLWVPSQWIAKSREEWNRANPRIKCGYCSAVDAKSKQGAK